MHSTHLDECAEVYLALSEHPDRHKVKGQRYNISSHRCKALEQVAHALAKEYDSLWRSEVLRPRRDQCDGGSGVAIDFLSPMGRISEDQKEF